MRFSATVIVASLAATVAAAPTSPVAPSVLEKRDNICGDSTFVNNSSGGSPLISDCQRLFDNIAGNGAWWVYGTQSKIASYGTCEFGARSMDGRTITRIGNEDVRDLIRDSIARFAWQGKVGASGIAICGSSTQTWWGVYHT